MRRVHRFAPFVRFGALAACAAALCACGGGRAAAPIANRSTRSAASEIRTVDWQNRTYVLDEIGEITVRNGQAEFGLTEDNKVTAASDAPGGNGSYRVEPPLYADIDGDGIDDAVISGVLATGGTGQFSEVRIYTMRAGKVVQLAVIPGGDRGDGGIKHVALDGSTVIVDRNELADGDGICCASSWRRERWQWRAGELVEDAAAREGHTGEP